MLKMFAKNFVLALSSVTCVSLLASTVARADLITTEKMQRPVIHFKTDDDGKTYHIQRCSLDLKDCEADSKHTGAWERVTLLEGSKRIQWHGKEQLTEDVTAGTALTVAGVIAFVAWAPADAVVGGATAGVVVAEDVEADLLSVSAIRTMCSDVAAGAARLGIRAIRFHVKNPASYAVVIGAVATAAGTVGGVFTKYTNFDPGNAANPVVLGWDAAKTLTPETIDGKVTIHENMDFVQAYLDAVLSNIPNNDDGSTPSGS